MKITILLLSLAVPVVGYADTTKNIPKSATSSLSVANPKNGASKMSNQTLDTRLMAAVEEQADLDTIRELVEAGANVNSVAGFGKKHSVLYQAAQNGMNDVIEFLLSKGANIEVGEDGGVTPLMAAAEQGQLRTVIVLIRHGANVRASDQNGWGAIDWAEASDYDTREIIRLLKNPSTAMTYKMPDQWMRLYRDEVK